MTSSDHATRFSGFPPAGHDFLRGLEADNSKPYFDAHRETYEAAIREPLELLLAEMVPRYGPGKVFRPNRDVRFSPDKSPYKTAAAAYAGEVFAVYVSLSSGGLQVGGGMYEPSRDQLARARSAIDEHPRAGGELASIVEALERSGFSLAGPALKTAPRGYPKDHARIDLLRLKRYAALRSVDPGPEVHDAERSRALIFGAWEELGPLADWLHEHAGPTRT